MTTEISQSKDRRRTSMLERVFNVDMGRVLARAARPPWTHPKGSEARLTIDGEWQCGSVALDGRTLLEVAFDWKEQFEAKGWKL